MMRQSSSRNNRSRGWKVKHVLQMCLLVAVCMWLLYQVKHSHDKKKAFEEGTLNVTDRVEESRPEFLKLGRKDPQGTTVVTAADDTTQNREDENEETEETAEQQSALEDNEEEEGRGAGDEMDESDQERADDEAEAGEEFGDEEKEGQLEDVDLPDNGDHEDDEGKSQGAREEHYKADDASSAVVRDTQEIVQENENLGAGNLDEEQKDITEKDELESDDGAADTEVASRDDETHDVPTTGENQLDNNISLNDTAVREVESQVESLPNSTMVLESAGHIEEHSIITSNSSDQLEQHDNSTTFEPNPETEWQSNSTGNVTDEQMDATNVTTGNNIETNDSTAENEAVRLDATQDRDRGNGTSMPIEENSISENILVEETGNSNVTGGLDESDGILNTSSVTAGDGDAVQGETTNSSSDASSNTEDDREARTDLATLPDIQVGMRKEEEIAAE